MHLSCINHRVYNYMYKMQHFILATLPVMWLLKQTCAQSSLYVKMFMGPEDKDLFYVEEGGSKDIECYVLGVESLTIDLKWSGPSVNESLPQKKSLNYLEEGRQRVGNWLHIKQFSDAAVGTYTCRAITSKPQDLSRHITIAKSCEIGKFGPPSCTKSCSEHCKTGPDGAKGRNCDHINGTCLNGCLEGYTGSMCADCEIGKFDPSSCTKNCSKHCKTGPDGAKGRKCDYKNGTCLYGCLKGYTGSMCTVKPKEPGGMSIAEIVGTVVGIIAGIALFVLLVIAYWKRKQIQRKFHKCCRFKKAEFEDVNSSQSARKKETPFVEDSNRGKKKDAVETGQDGQPQHHQRQKTDNAQNGDQEGQSLLNSSNTSKPEEIDQDGNSSQNLQEEETSLVGVNSNGEKRDVVDTGLDVLNSVPNEQLEAAKAPGPVASPPHTVPKDNLQELKKKTDGNSSQNLQEEETSLVGVNSNGEKRDVVDTGLDVLNSVPNEQLEAAKAPGPVASPPHTVPKDNLQELKKKTDENSEQIKLLMDAKSTDEAKMKELQNKIETLSVRLENESSANKAEIERLQNEIAEKSKQIETLENETGANKAEIERMQNEIAEKSKQIETLEKARRADQDKIAKLTEERDRYKENCSRLQEEINSMSKFKDEVKGLLNDCLNELTKNAVGAIDERNNVHEPRERLLRQSRQSRDVASQPVLEDTEGEPLLREQNRKDVARRTNNT